MNSALACEFVESDISFPKIHVNLCVHTSFYFSALLQYTYALSASSDAYECSCFLRRRRRRCWFKEKKNEKKKTRKKTKRATDRLYILLYPRKSTSKIWKKSSISLSCATISSYQYFRQTSERTSVLHLRTSILRKDRLRRTPIFAAGGGAGKLIIGLFAVCLI